MVWAQPAEPSDMKLAATINMIALEELVHFLIELPRIYPPIWYIERSCVERPSSR
jgi:hypothetical protein